MTDTPKLYQAIHAQPAAIRALLSDWQSTTQVAQQIAGKGRIFLCGIGTSYHAAIVGSYLLRLAGADAWAVRSFEFVQYPQPLRADDAVIVISHRGSKTYGAMALQHAREAGVATLGITGKNTKMQGADQTIETVEQDPSSTHSISYTATLTRLAQLAVQLAKAHGMIEQAQRLEQGLALVPSLIERMLTQEDSIRTLAQDAIIHNRRLYFAGAGPNAATAPEGALKAKESAYVTAEGFELEQAIHGPQVAFEAEDLIIPISVRGAAQERMRDFLLAQSEIGSRVWLIGMAPDEETATLLQRTSWQAFPIATDANFLEELTPLLTVVPLQLLANFLAIARGTNADSFRLEQEAYKRASTRFHL